MATLKEIRNRIRSITNTGQITRAMKMVAAANLRHVQTSMVSSRAYSERAEKMLESVFVSKLAENSIYIKPKKGNGKSVYLIVVGNRGLCGVYNIALLQFAKKIMDEDPHSKYVYVAGKWGREVFANMGIDIDEEFPVLSEDPKSDESRQIVDRLKQLYMQEDTGNIYMIFQTYVSAMKQEPSVKQLFPVDTGIMQKKHAKNNDDKLRFTDYYFEPDKKDVLDRLIEIYADSFVLANLKEAKCAEHTARMTAMTNANDNIDQLLNKLQTTYNRVRQENITNEISEIVGGAAALK